MTYYTKSIKFIVILLLGSFDLCGQGQSDFLDILSDKLVEYCRLYPREEIYVHTDRGEYIAGENLWFKIYLFDRQSSRLSSESSIAYFEILNPENRPVVRKRIRLQNGSGPGQVALPDTLSSGSYLIRTYTNWMKNFMPENCFTKTIVIHNALDGKTFPDNTDSAVTAGENDQHDSLMEFEQSGIEVRVNRSSPGRVEISVNTNEDFRTVNNRRCYLFIQTRGIVNYKTSVALRGDTTLISLPGNSLIPGINQISVFGFNGRPVTETYIYTPEEPVKLLNLSCTSNNSPRDKIEMGIETIPNGISSMGKYSDLSISVAPHGLNSFPGIDDYMIFGSEFGIIPEEILQKGINNIPDEQLGKFLDGIRSNWIDWNTVLGSKYPEIKYEKEYDYHYIYGRLQNRNSQEPDKEKYVFLSIPGKEAVFQYAKTNDIGDFRFSLKIDEGVMEFIIQPEEIDGGNAINIEPSFSESYPTISGMKERPEDRIPDNISRLAVNYQVMKIYQSDEVPPDTLSPLIIKGSRRFYGRPDIELVMDDYIKLPVMHEIFFELMPGVIMKKEKSGYDITITDPVDNRILSKPPGLFVDGVVIRDPDIIAELDPELVEKIDAVRSRYFVGDYMFYGLVNIITRNGDFSDIILPDYAVRLPYSIIEPSETFICNNYSSPEEIQSRIPDFRNTLYWNPSVPSINNGKTSVDFTASDLRSEYEIILQGILPDGKCISEKKIIEVN